MKKWLYTAAATAVVATFGGFDSEAQASTHKVSSGDSLWKIANKYQVSVDHLKKLNNLSSELIRPDQVLKISGKADLSATHKTASTHAQPTTQTEVYTVKAGDTLSAIASKSGISLKDLMAFNELKTHTIYVGQSLNVKASSLPPKQTTQPAAPAVLTDYTVKAGDTLSKIALNNGISLTKLIELNQLSGHTIYVGQKLSVSGKPVSKPKQTVTKPTTSANDSSYIVQSGDTLSKIAMIHKVSLSDLKNMNKLTSDTIRSGQKLIVQTSYRDEKPQQTVTGQAGSSVSELLTEAYAHVGTEYVWGGASPEGFDCSGFIYYVYNQAGFDISRTNSEGYHARSFDINTPQPGDLVFFENTYKKGISHLGIYIGDNQFIHASDNGVMISSLDSHYWQSKFESFKRFY